MNVCNNGRNVPTREEWMKNGLQSKAQEFQMILGKYQLLAIMNYHQQAKGEKCREKFFSSFSTSNRALIPYQNTVK